jgi:hypothetical protein
VPTWADAVSRSCPKVLAAAEVTAGIASGGALTLAVVIKLPTTKPGVHLIALLPIQRSGIRHQYREIRIFWYPSLLGRRAILRISNASRGYPFEAGMKIGIAHRLVPPDIRRTCDPELCDGKAWSNRLCDPARVEAGRGRHHRQFGRAWAHGHPGRYGHPEGVAGAVLFLASDPASWITDRVLPVTGSPVSRARAEGETYE